ncbi:MAG: hypothetical protein HYW51_01900 [Candidatus Doudnabacteria bacterium]|nr:hypothetical protein [Candidatus Doudnabacteria bacterium]
MKKIIASVGLAAMLLMVAGAADAAVIRMVNDSSVATSAATWSILANILNNNSAGILNTVTSTGNSGANTVVSADDQTGTSVTTGNTGAASAVDGAAGPGNVANTNVVSETLETPDGADNLIEDVDDSSVATTASADSLENNLTNNNEVEVDNDVDGTSNSGTNSVVSGDSLTTTTVSTGTNLAASLLSQDFNLNIKEVIRTIRQRP